MKKLYRTAAFYTVLGLVGGVFFREFTKIQGYQGVTVLSTTHVHALVLGMFMFFLLMVLEKNFGLMRAKAFSKFYYFYNSGLILTLVMLWIRGTLEVLKITVSDGTLTSGMDAMIAGIAGIGHILLGIGLFFVFRALKECLFKEA